MIHLDVRVDAPTLERLLAEQADIRILDVGTPAEFESAHIPGSYNVPLDTLAEHVTDIALHVSDPLVCRSGNRAVVLDASAITDIDASGVHALHGLDRDLATAGVELHLATVRGPVRDALARSGVWDELVDRVHASVAAACAVTAPDSPWHRIGSGESPGDRRVV